MKDQPLSADASPTALSPGYIANFNLKEDKEDPEEDPADYPANEGDNSDDDNDDDDVEKDEEDEEEEEHLAPADPSAVPTDDPACITEFAAILPSSSPPPENVESLKDNIRETMITVNQGMSVEEIERVVAQRVANAIEAIAIYETKTNMARKSISQTEQQECKLAENANNKRKWEGNHNGQCTVKVRELQKVRSYIAMNVESRALQEDCPEQKNQSHKNQIGECTSKKIFLSYLAHDTAKEVEDNPRRSELEDVPIVLRIFLSIQQNRTAGLLHSTKQERTEEHLKQILNLLKKMIDLQILSKILKFSKIRQTNDKTHQEKVKLEWGDQQEQLFKLYKAKVCSAPILSLPEGSEDFIHNCNATKRVWSAVLMQREKVISYRITPVEDS
ncbi:putative reverse transcriptase domain-containing protein [Tanacetum coccineum]|uniref:Reverse transcriptase domain-containing protein n=1 Tax=Tanacetum coccineum TaxID=301880 RepID=A0ABQ5G7V2_9ASTR